MRNISRSVTKKDHTVKIDGSTMYVGDYSNENILHGQIVRSPYAHANIVKIIPPKLPADYFYVDHNDVPGLNRVSIGKNDMPIYAERTVEYIGDPILMVVGPEKEDVKRFADEFEIVFDVQSPVISMEESDTVFFEAKLSKGDTQNAFFEADFIFQDCFETGYQEHAYLETQGMIAKYEEGKITVSGSLQCPYYVHAAVVQALGIDKDSVRIVQETTGGGFGGKEAFPSILASQIAIAAYKANGLPVRVVFDRKEDMEFTSKRHPSLCTYKVAVKRGFVIAMDIDITLNSGAYTTVSKAVLERGVAASSGVYNIENLRVSGRTVKTNTVPTGAYRGFGAPQTFFAVEMVMEHIARKLQVDSLLFKRQHIVKQGDSTSTSGKYHFNVPLNSMIDEVSIMSDYHNKRKKYKQPQTGRYRKGIGISLWFHGSGFTGAGEKEVIKAKVRLHKCSDDRVKILASQTDIGQGIKTTLCKIVSNEAGIPLTEVSYENPDTDFVPNSGPTNASRSLMVVGELVRRAAIQLRGKWKQGKEQVVEEKYQEPSYLNSFNSVTFKGDAYPVYSWAACVVEVQVDTLTGISKVLGAWACFDVGTPIDMNIVLGQMEGGMMQGIGFSSMEQIPVDSNGRIRNNSFSDYIIPTSVDVPVLEVKMYVEEYLNGPYGAKGAGELPLVGVPAAYISALEQAIEADINFIPFSQEDTVKRLYRL